MQNLESYIAELSKLYAEILNDAVVLIKQPIPAAIGEGLIGILVVLIIVWFLQYRAKKKYRLLEDEMDRQQRSLQETLKQKVKNITTLEQICLDQKEDLNFAQEKIVQLEEIARNTPVLENRIEQQLRQLEALTESISSEFDSEQQSTESVGAELAAESTSLSGEAVIDQLSARLYQQLSQLHQQILDQSRLIVDLQSELDAKTESVAQQIITKSQELPTIAKARFGERVIEPFQMRVDGIKQLVQAVPGQARVKVDQILIDPIYQRVEEIKSTLSQIPTQSSAQLNKMVLDPLNHFIEQVNQAVKNLNEFSHVRFNQLVANPLQDLINRFKMDGRSLSREGRENFLRIIIQPLEKLLVEIKQVLASLPESGNARLKTQLLEPAKQKLKELSESGKQNSIKSLKDAGNWMLDSISRSHNAPASA